MGLRKILYAVRDLTARRQSQVGGTKLTGQQTAVAAVAVIIIIVAGFFIIKQLVGGGSTVRGSGLAWYYDTVTGKVFTDKANLFPPITSPDGNPAVRVHYFTCGSNSQKDRFVGFYDKYTQEAKAKLEAAMKSQSPGPMPPLAMPGAGGQLYSLDGKTWFSSFDPRFQKELQKNLACPDGKHARVVPAE